MIRRKCEVVKGRRGDDRGWLDNDEHDAPRGDERHEEQAAQHATPETFSREGSALRAGQVAQALTLGTARPDAVLVLIDADEQIAVRERDLQEVQPIDDGRTTIWELPISEPHDSASECGNGPASVDGHTGRRRTRLEPRISRAEAVEGPRVPHAVPVQTVAGEEREDTQTVHGRGREARRRRFGEVAG